MPPKAKRNSLKGTWYLFALLLLAARAAGAIGFTGRVTGEDGVTGLSAVTVQALYPSNDSVAYSAVTNGSGYYSITAPAGTYHVQASPSGYFPSVRSSYTVTTGDVNVDFALQPTGVEAGRDDFSAQNWSNTFLADRLSNNGNVTLFGTDSTGGGDYDGITRNVGTIGMGIYPFLTIRHRYERFGGALGVQFIFDYGGGWNDRVNMFPDTGQSWPWREDTFPTLDNVSTAFFLNGDAPAGGNHYLDYMVFHSRDRGYISGQVKNLAGVPLPNSRVQVRRSTHVVGEALSDPSGNYTIWVATDIGGYNVFFSTNGTAQFRQDGVAVNGRVQTTVNINIDTAPPAAVTDLNATNVGMNGLTLGWMAPGDDGWSGTLNSSGFLIQYSTDQAQVWSPQFAQINIPVSGVNPYSPQSHPIGGLAPNTTSYFRVWTRDAYGNFSALSNGATATTLIEQPGGVYFSEVSTYGVVASAYASTFTNLGTGMTGFSFDSGGGFGPWQGGYGWYDSGTTMPGARYHSAGAAVGRKIYILGGTTNSSDYYASNFEYDPVSNSWATRAAMPNGRFGLAAAAVAGRVYAIGGIKTTVVQSANEAYDPVSNTWTPAGTLRGIPTPREGLVLAVAAGKIYAIGGQDAGGTVYGKVEVYDPGSDTWDISAPPMSPARRGAAAAVLGNKIYVTGGYNIGYKSDVSVYDTSAKSWGIAPPLQIQRAGHATAAVGNKVYVFAGYNIAYQNKTEVFDPANSTWTYAAPIPAPRESMGYATLNGRLYLAGGLGGGGAMDDARMFDPGVSSTFTYLMPNTQYSYRVKARNAAGLETGPSGWNSFYTLAVATVSGSNTFTEVSFDRVSLQWASGSPGFYNGPNASYKVQASTSPKFAGEIRERTPWDSTFTTIDNLRAKTTYYFRVQAYNSQGQSDHYWTLLGSTFTPKAPLPGTVVSQDAYYSPLENRNWGRSAARNSKGDIYAAYAKKFGGNFRIFVARSADNGDTWGDTTAVPVENLGPYDQAWPALAVDSSDYLHLVWGGNDGADAESKCFYSSAAAPGTAWSAPVKIPADPYEGVEKHFNIAVDGNDGLHIAWAGYDGSAMDMVRVRYSSRAANGNWAAFTRVNDVSLATDHPALAIDSKNGVHIVARQATSGGSSLTPAIVHSSRTTGGWYPWTPVYNVGAYPQGGPSLTIDSGGRLFAAWSGPDATYSNAQVKYAIRSAGGAWGSWNYVGTPAPEAPQLHPSAAADAAGKVYVLWSGSTTASSAVNLRGADFDDASWKPIDELSSEETGAQNYVQLRWAGWRNNGGAIDVLWSSYDGVSSTATLRHIYGSDVPMSPGWSKTAWVLPAGCAYAVNVRQDGGADFRDIRGALNALPTEISTNTCVVVRDDGVYREAVVVDGFRYRYWEDPRYRISVMADPTFVSSAPKVAAPLGTYAAFDLRVDSVTVQGFVIQSTDTMNYGVYASSSYARISSVTVSGSFNMDAVRLAGGYGTLSYSSVTATGTNSGAIKLSGGGNSLSNVYAAAQYNFYSPLWFDYSSSNTVTRSMFYQQEGNAMTLSFSHNNQISFSTITGRMSPYSGIYFTGSDNNSVSDSYVYSQDGYGVRMENYSDYNSFLNSTVTAGGTTNPAFYVNGSDNLTVSGSYVGAFSNTGLELRGGSDNAYIARSTINGSGFSYTAFYANASSSATITGSRLLNTSLGGAMILDSSSFNRILGAVVSGGNSDAVAMVTNSGYNTISRSFISAGLAKGVMIHTNSNFNTLEYSTVTSFGWGATDAAFYAASATQSVVSCYLQGSTAVYIDNGFMMVRDSLLVATNTYGAGLNMKNTPQGLFMTSTTVRGGPQGMALLLSGGNGGKVELSSNAVTGGAYGLRLGSQNAGFRLQISTINFNALTAGATAIMFTGGSHGATITAAGFHSAGLGINVGAVGLVWPSSITMRGATGPKAGPDYEYDPGGFISWPSARAFKIKPGPADTGLPRSPALYAGANETDGPVQYEFQLDTSAGMDSQAGQPLYKFSQSAALFFPDKGAFSGADSTVTAYGDAYLPASTATFVFFHSAAQRLSPQTWYYWRVRAKSGGVSYYGDWSITDSFLTGQAASDSPVNNVGVRDVAVSSPTGLSAAITFQLYANDVSSQATPGGGGFNTAQWLFVKFSTQAGADGSWRHATISTGTTASWWNSALTVPSDRRGAFVDNSTSQSFWNSTVTLRWNYAEDGVAGPADAQVKVFAVTMINVHGGPFVYNAGGIGGSSYNNYGGGVEIQVNAAGNTPSGAALGWPNGYNSFYLMRYELTQGQYADFLNTVHSSTASARYEPTADNGHNITYAAGNPYGSRYAAADRFSVKNYLSVSDLWSWLSWAALRPLTEMEFEKAARDKAPDNRVYPWGNTEPGTETYTPVHEGGAHTRHYMNFYNPSGKVLQAGRYLSGDLPREMEQMGIAPRVIADLGGNAAEQVINCSHSPAPSNGGGTEAWPASWPAPDSSAKGTRGGGFVNSSVGGKVSERGSVSSGTDSRASYLGGRGARSR